MIAYRCRYRSTRIRRTQLAERRFGAGGILALEGPPGIGKTSLLKAAARDAAGLQVAQARPDGTRADVPAGGRSHSVGEPDPHGDEPLSPSGPAGSLGALSTAVTAAGTGDRPLSGEVFPHLTNLLRDLASRAPAMLLVDDAQWADRASLEWIRCQASRPRRPGLSFGRSGP